MAARYPRRRHAGPGRAPDSIDRCPRVPLIAPAPYWGAWVGAATAPAGAFAAASAAAFFW
jgi:hypothetical protein